MGGAPAGFLGATVATSNGVPNGYQVLMPVTQTVSVANGTLGALYGAPTSGFGVNALQTVTTLQPFGAYNKGRVKPGAPRAGRAQISQKTPKKIVPPPPVLTHRPLGRSISGRLPINLDAAVSGVALCGTLAGQLFFGWAGDRFGRKVVYGATLMVMCFCAAAQSMSFGTNGAAVVGTLCFWRFFLGFGVGGDYPLSATISAHAAAAATTRPVWPAPRATPP